VLITAAVALVGANNYLRELEELRRWEFGDLAPRDDEVWLVADRLAAKRRYKGRAASAVEIVQLDEESIGMQDLDVIGIAGIGGEIAEVERADCVCLRGHRCRQHVPVL